GITGVAASGNTLTFSGKRKSCTTTPASISLGSQFGHNPGQWNANGLWLPQAVSNSNALAYDTVINNNDETGGGRRFQDFTVSTQGSPNSGLNANTLAASIVANANTLNFINIYGQTVAVVYLSDGALAEGTLTASSQGFGYLNASGNTVTSQFGSGSITFQKI